MMMMMVVVVVVGGERVQSTSPTPGLCEEGMGVWGVFHKGWWGIV